MPATSLAAQLYTLRDFLKTPGDIAATLKKVKRIGYDAVQVSGMGKIDPSELASILSGEGLTCCVTHVGLERMKNETQQVVDEHRLWGCAYTAVGSFAAHSEAGWLQFAEDYNAVAAKFEGSGLSIGYHNHSHELARYNGRTALRLLVDHLRPPVWMEIDTYWVAHGGGDPAQWVRDVSGRIPCVHLKDMAVDAGQKQFMAEVGEGNLNWPAVLSACREAGVKWYVVEQDVCRRDPFESLAISLRNLKAMGLS